MQEMKENSQVSCDFENVLTTGGIDAEGHIFISLMDCFKEIIESKSLSTENIQTIGTNTMLHAYSSEIIKPKKKKKLFMVLYQEINIYVSIPILSSEDRPTPLNNRLTVLAKLWCYMVYNLGFS